LPKPTMSETEIAVGKAFVEQTCRKECHELGVGSPEFDWRPEVDLHYELRISIPDRENPIQCRISRANLQDDAGFQAADIVKRVIAAAVRRPGAGYS